MYKQRCKTTKKDDWLDLLASKLVEVRLSELGFQFIPGITPLFNRFKQYVQARAFIVKPSSSIIDDGKKKRDK